MLSHLSSASNNIESGTEVFQGEIHSVSPTYYFYSPLVTAQDSKNMIIILLLNANMPCHWWVYVHICDFVK